MRARHLLKPFNGKEASKFGYQGRIGLSAAVLLEIHGKPDLFAQVKESPYGDDWLEDLLDQADKQSIVVIQ